MDFTGRWALRSALQRLLRSSLIAGAAFDVVAATVIIRRELLSTANGLELSAASFYPAGLAVGLLMTATAAPALAYDPRRHAPSIGAFARGHAAVALVWLLAGGGAPAIAAVAIAGTQIATWAAFRR